MSRLPELEVKNYKFYMLAKRSHLSLYILQASHLWGTYEWYLWFDFHRWEICVSERLHSLQATKPKIKSRFIWFRVRYTFHCILQNQKFQTACKMCSAAHSLYKCVWEFSGEAEWPVVLCWVNVEEQISQEHVWQEGLLVGQLMDSRVIYLLGKR